MLFNSPFEQIFYSPEDPSRDPIDELLDPIDEPYESTIDKLINYVMHTPYNTNPAILLQLIRDLDFYEVDILRYGPEKPEEHQVPEVNFGGMV